MEFDSELQNSSSSRGSLQEKILANIRVPWKLNLLILVMTVGIVGIFFTAIRGIEAIRNQQQTNFKYISTPIIALNEADIALGEVQTELILLENSALSAEEKSLHLENIVKAENVVELTLQKYEADWLAYGELTFNTGISQTRKKEIQQALNALYENEGSLLGQIKNNYSAYNVESDSFYQNIKNGRYDDKAEERVYHSLISIQTPLRQLISVLNERLQLADEISQSNYQAITIRMFLALTIAIGIGLMFSSSIARSISSRLIILGNDALALQDNLLDRRTIVSMTGKDEIALVSRSFDEMSVRLRETFEDLENKVRERTANLAAATAESNKRAQQFEAITKVAGAISATQNLQELLPTIAKVISERFGFYHVGIFLNDPTNQIAILRAANSEGGKKMLQRSHQLKIGEQGIVGYVTQTGYPRIALNVGEDATYFNNPDLPLTLSEMALPLKAGNQVFGALDIQSTEVGSFSDEDFESVSTLADQVSLAIQNTRLFDLTKKTLAESESIQRQYIRENWSRLSKDEKLSGFRYSGAGAVPLDGETKIIAREDIKDKQEFSVPIILRGETIGTLSVQVPKSDHVSTDQIDLIKAVAERVALSAENARLFEDVTRRAERERIISDIASKIGTSVHTESILRTTATELSQLLDDAEIFINLQTTDMKKRETE